MLEHLSYALVEVLFIFLRLVRERGFSAAAPYELLCFSVVHINHKRSFFVILFRGGGVAETSEASPAPSASEAVIERLQRSLRLCRLDGHDSNVSAAVYLSPAFGLQLRVYGILNSGVPKGIGTVNCLPRISLVLREVGLMSKSVLMCWPSADPNNAIKNAPQIVIRDKAFI